MPRVIAPACTMIGHSTLDGLRLECPAARTACGESQSSSKGRSGRCSATRPWAGWKQLLSAHCVRRELARHTAPQEMLGLQAAHLQVGRHAREQLYQLLIRQRHARLQRVRHADLGRCIAGGCGAGRTSGRRRAPGRPGHWLRTQRTARAGVRPSDPADPVHSGDRGRRGPGAPPR